VVLLSVKDELPQRAVVILLNLFSDLRAKFVDIQRGVLRRYWREPLELSFKILQRRRKVWTGWVRRWGRWWGAGPGVKPTAWIPWCLSLEGALCATGGGLLAEAAFDDLHVMHESCNGAGGLG